MDDLGGTALYAQSNDLQALQVNHVAGCLLLCPCSPERKESKETKMIADIRPPFYLKTEVQPVLLSENWKQLGDLLLRNLLRFRLSGTDLAACLTVLLPGSSRGQVRLAANTP